MGNGRNICRVHGKSCERTSAKKSKPDKGSSSFRNDTRSYSKSNLRREESIVAKQTLSTWRHASTGSQVQRDEPTNRSIAIGSRSRSASNQKSAARPSSSSTARHTPRNEGVRGKKNCPKHGDSCTHAIFSEKSRPNRSTPEKFKDKKQSPSKSESTHESKPKKHQGSSNKEKHQRENSPSSRSTSVITIIAETIRAKKRSSSNKPETKEDKVSKSYKSHKTPLQRTPSSNKNSTKRASSNCHHQHHSSSRKHGFGSCSSAQIGGMRSSSYREGSLGSFRRTEESRSKSFSGSKTAGRYRKETGITELSNPSQRIRDSCQSARFIMFYASDMIDLARRERRRKRAAYKTRLVRSKSFVHASHPNSPDDVTASDRLDAFDKYLLRVKNDGEKQIKISDVPRWLDNETQETLRMLAKLYLNKIRIKHHLRHVSLNHHLTKVTGKHNYDQAYVLRVDKTSHEGSDGRELKDRLKAVGYKSHYAFELLARGPESVSEVLEYFMGRSRYRKVLLHPRLSAMGIHGGRDILGNWFWTLVICG